MNQVVQRRLGLRPNPQTRAEAAHLLYVNGWEPGKGHGIVPRMTSPVRIAACLAVPARRAIWARYSLLREAIGGEPPRVRSYPEKRAVQRNTYAA